MEKYLLIYVINDYPHEDDGMYYLKFDTENQMHEKANELLTSDKDVSIHVAIKIEERFKYEPKEKIIEYKPKQL